MLQIMLHRTKTEGSVPGAVYHVMNRGDRQEDIFPAILSRRHYFKFGGRVGEVSGVACNDAPGPLAPREGRVE